ncbi:MAG: hypothetical protein U0905_10265 [Pirellulales bacterium]
MTKRHGRRLPSEPTQEFLEKPVEQLSELDRQHLNRRLIEYAFSPMRCAIPAESHFTGWLCRHEGRKLSPLPLSSRKVRMIVETIVPQMVMKVGFGYRGHVGRHRGDQSHGARYVPAWVASPASQQTCFPFVAVSF